ncbi:MAG: alpha-amlyase [Bacteroidetes bacterium]|nr:MAG: alpha-amlyase [Bacteroidota bacterium]
MRFLILPLLLLVHFLPAQPRLERVEPPHWWVGMQNAQLQLMLYGQDIGHLKPSVEATGITVLRAIRVPNENYLFVDLEIGPEATTGTFNLNLLEGNKVVLTYPYTLEARQPGSAQRRGFDSRDAIYLITPDRYANGDPGNDSVEGLADKANRRDSEKRHGGDIEGIRQHLDYYRDMGFTGLWLNPVLENDQPRSSYHGYSTTDFYEVDARLGTNESYRTLCAEAKEKGLLMVMDMVANHAGSGHWWTEDLPTPDWYNRPPAGMGDYRQTNHRRTTLEDPHAAPSDRQWFQDGWFVPSMPDLNQRNPLMATYLIQNAIWWVEYADLGGIRMDTYSYPDKDFMARWTQAIMAEYPHFSIVGEEWSPFVPIVAHWQAGNDNGYPSALNSLMDFPLQISLVEGLKEQESWNSGLLKIYETLALDYLYPDPDMLMIFPDNHDMSRIFTQLDEDYDLWQNAMAFILTTRGIPQIFYGTEILMSHPGTDAHVEIRRDFPGGWAGDAVNAFTGEGLSEQARQAQALMRRLLTWRKENPVIHTGKLTHYGPLHDGVYVYFRQDADKTVMVVLNKNEEAFRLKLDRFRETMGPVREGYDVIGQRKLPLEETLTLPPRSPLVIEWER